MITIEKYNSNIHDTTCKPEKAIGLYCNWLWVILIAADGRAMPRWSTLNVPMQEATDLFNLTWKNGHKDVPIAPRCPILVHATSGCPYKARSDGEATPGSSA